MDAADDDEIVVGELQQFHAKDRTGREVEPALRFLGGQTEGFRFPRFEREMPKVDERHRAPLRRADDLHRLVALQLEGRAERLVPA